MDGKLLPQSNAKEKSHQELYKKVSLKCSKLKDISEKYHNFRCAYDRAHQSKESLYRKFVIDSAKDCTFLFEGKIVCKSCGNYRPRTEEFVFVCSCGQFTHFNMTITNQGNPVKANLVLSIERTDLTIMTIFSISKKFGKNEKYQQSWQFQRCTFNGPTIRYHNGSSFTDTYGGGYFTRNGSIIFICDINVLQIDDNLSNIHRHINIESTEIMKKLSNQFLEANLDLAEPYSQYTDIALCVGKDKIYCHKLILASSSMFFAKMFESNMKESKSNEITLKEVELETIKRAVLYLYTDTIENNKVDFNLLAIADMYEIIPLRNTCIKILSSTICQRNIVEIWITAYQHNIEELVHESVAFMVQNWKDLGKNDNIRELCEQYPNLLFMVSTLLVDSA